MQRSVSLSLLVILLFLFLPLSPKMPTTGLDYSWGIALSEALSQGMAFGKEILFTLGPYSFLYTQVYHPDTSFLMFLVGLDLSLAYWLSLKLLMKNSILVWKIAVLLFFIFFLYSRDTLLSFYPILAVLVFTAVEKKKLPLWQEILIINPLGLLPLVKGTFMILCIAAVLLYSAIYRRGFILAIAVFSTALFWLVSGQDLFNLPAFFVTTIELSSGFTQAMSLNYPDSLHWLYALFSAGIIVFIGLQKQRTGQEKWLLLGLFSIFLFMSYKAGFVRYYGHTFIPAVSILLCALTLPFLFKSRIVLPLLGGAILVWFTIINSYGGFTLKQHWQAVFGDAWYGLKKSFADPDWKNQEYHLLQAYISQQQPLPPISGTIDSYSANQALLIASKLPWRPRPVFQSYSVFNKHFADLNREWLLGMGPEYVLFKIDPIDGRLPALEDGASWPVFFNNFKLTYRNNEFLLLQKVSNSPIPLNPLGMRQVRFGEIIPLSQTTRLLFARFTIKLNTLGHMLQFLDKPSEVHVKLYLKEGTIETFRFIPAMAEDVLLLSPLVKNNADFAEIMMDEKLPKKNRVVAIQFMHGKGWQEEFNMELFG